MKLRPGEPEEAGMDPARVRLIAQRAAEWVEQGITPALVVLVARRGIVVLHEAYGRLTPAADSPPLPRSAIFPLVSITKPITATAAMILVEDGLLGLNRPVCEYLPEFTGEGKQAVLVHHLLTHTSGLRDEDVAAHAEAKTGTVAIPPRAENQHPAVHESLFLGYDTPLWKPPGVEMSYCGFGYELLGEIIRRVGGNSLDVHTATRICAPLGMTDTHYVLPEEKRHRVVRRPADWPDSWLDDESGQTTPWAGGGLFSTAMDMATFGQMFLDRGRYGDVRVLAPATVAAMTCNQIPGIAAGVVGEYFPEASWGFGWDIHGHKKALYFGSLHSPAAFGHGGSGGVYLWIDPTYDIVGVYFSVAAPGALDRPQWCGDLFTNAVTAAVSDV